MLGACRLWNAALKKPLPLDLQTPSTIPLSAEGEGDDEHAYNEQPKEPRDVKRAISWDVGMDATLTSHDLIPVAIFEDDILCEHGEP